MEIQRINHLHCSENLRVPYFIEELLTKFTVIGGTASQELAKTIAKKLKANYVKTDLRIFPDGKSKITLASKPKKGTSMVVRE